MATPRRSGLRVLLVDDHPVVRRGLRGILIDAFRGAVIHEVGLGREAERLAQTHPWDIVLLDLQLPDGSGLEVLRSIRTKRPEIPVLILSMHPVDPFARGAIAAGASGYLTKDAADTELVIAMSQVMRGRTYFSPAALEQASSSRPHEKLSRREYDVLRLIGSGRRVSEIAEQLGLSVKTVSTYRTRVLKKMGLRTNAELIHYAVRHGIAH